MQLQHNEEQILLNQPDHPLLTAACASIESRIKNEIKEAYETYNLAQPTDMFVEDPVGVDGQQESKTYVEAPDVYDVDKMTQDATVREEKRARVIIDGHVYIEDVDPDTIDVPMDKDCKSLLTQKERLAKQLDAQREVVRQQRAKNKAAAPKFRDKNGDGEKRPRWKYIAQTVNTRELKRQTHFKKRSSTSYVNNSPHNTLVEHDGELRVANMEEIQTVAWKPTRHPQEHTYQWVKRGWLDRTNRGQRKAWGFGPPRLEKKVETEEEEKKAAADSAEASSESGEESKAKGDDEANKAAEQTGEDTGKESSSDNTKNAPESKNDDVKEADKKESASDDKSDKSNKK